MGKPTITIVGPGRLGTALALALHAAGYRIDEIVSREAASSLRSASRLARRVGARAATAKTANLAAGVVWLSVADRDIAATAKSLAAIRSAARKRGASLEARHDWRGKTVFHSSGALGSEELRALRERGADVASVHPMMTFVHAQAPSLAGVSFALEGGPAARRLARRIVRSLGASAVDIATKDKVLYHAWGAFASPLITCELAMADRIAAELGIGAEKARTMLAPILRQTLENYIAHGPAAAFSGPLVRGDVATVRQHLEQLSRAAGAREVYLALATSALETLPVGNRKDMEGLLRSALSHPIAPRAGAISVGHPQRPRRHKSPPASRNIGGIIQPY